MANRSRTASAAAVSRARSIQPRRANAGSIASVRFRRIDCDRHSPSTLRSSGMKPIPARIASRGPRMRSGGPSPRRTLARRRAIGADDGAQRLAPSGSRPDRPGPGSRRGGPRSSRRAAARRASSRRRGARPHQRRAASCAPVSAPPAPIISDTSSSSDAVSARALADDPAVAQHRDPVTELADLLEAMADVEDRGARRGEPAQVRERLGDLGRR